MNAVSNNGSSRRKRKKNFDGASNAKEKVDIENEEESMQQPIWHVVALNTLTMSAYSLFWFFKTWRDLKAHAIEKLDKEKSRAEASAVDPSDLKRLGEWNKLTEISPLIRTIGIIIPGWQLYLVFDLFKRVANISPLANHNRSTAIALAMTVSLGVMFAAAALPGAFYFLYLTGVVPIAIAQHLLNGYWRTQEKPGILIRHAFTPGELVAIILGASWLGLCIAHFMLISAR